MQADEIYHLGAMSHVTVSFETPEYTANVDGMGTLRLLGDPTRAKEKLGWEPRTSFADLVAEMVRADLEDARRNELYKTHGFKAFDYHE